jgi:hypothetical protein
MLLDFSDAYRSKAYSAKLKKLQEGIANNYPDALPNARDARPVYKVGNLVMPSPVAIETSTPMALRDAVASIGQKLTHALYYRECHKALSIRHRFTTGCYQIQNPAATTLTEYFTKLLPDATIGSRSNVRNYGERFSYISGVKNEEDFFVYAAQFGKGLILWGIVLGPNADLTAADGPLRNVSWHKGASGSTMSCESGDFRSGLQR